MKFWDELAFWVTIAIGIALFSKGFNPLFSSLINRLPHSFDGFKEAMAAS